MQFKDTLNKLFLAKAFEARMLNEAQALAPWSREHLTGSWMLRGVLAHPMFEQAQMADPASWVHCAHVMRSDDFNYLILCQRLREWEHRFVLPLTNLNVLRMVADNSALHLALASSGGGSYLHVTVAGGWATHLQDIVLARRPTPENLKSSLGDVVAKCLSTSSDVSGLPAVGDACVSVARVKARNATRSYRCESDSFESRTKTTAP